MHHYSTNTTDGWDGQGIPPEQDGLLALAQSFGQWRDARAPHAELWWSEYGYDTNGGPQTAPPLGPLSREEVQGAWLVRTALVLGASGAVQRGHMYMLADVSSQGHGKYATSGLLTDKASFFQRKAGWYYVSAFHWWVGHLAVVQQGQQGGPQGGLVQQGQVTVAVLAPAAGQGARPENNDVGKGCAGVGVRAPCGGGSAAPPSVSGGLAAWLPTGSGAKAPGSTLSLPKGAPGEGSSVKVVRLQKGQPQGVVTSATVGKGGSVELDVDETPLFVLW